eukprot:CAMPEP_0202978294 /NCGR_PEP_ID=MMETSP1396-20130829/84763_1 /ASSEMBLY_ACC=CAM_ASM_000872 /TAXON_ID= /ORGANISM="Pseudokeronopsis sp., Strain Brazil" /LENGTH=167 /DNA_ID=CAMNT_0049717215 /DNA_START=916 /DNA_END=1416 /DNA_ORIENTATION=-
MNLQSEYEKLIEQGRSLKLRLGEYVELKKFFEDVQEWKEITQRALSDWQCQDFSLNFIKNHVQVGLNLDVEEKEDLSALQAVEEMAASWKAMAQKFLNLRPLAKLDMGSAPEANQQQFALVLQREGANFKLVEVRGGAKESQQSYCICRRIDDEKTLMIACDTCLEW